MDNNFQSVPVTPEEELTGWLLNGTNLKVIQNERVAIAHNLLALNFDPKNPQDFMQQQAYLKGQLDMLNTIIDRHNDVSFKLANKQE